MVFSSLCMRGKDEVNHLGTFFFYIVWDAFVHPFFLRLDIKDVVIPDDRQENAQTIEENIFYLAEIPATFAVHAYFEVKVQPCCS